jgi:(2S)-methylsuccinyl-CoA dehydrogenase
MSASQPNPIPVDRIEALFAAIEAVVGESVAVASSTTEKGRRIDDHQVHCERVAYAATQVEACRSILQFAKDADAAGSDESALYLEQAAVYVGEVASRLGAEMRAAANDYGLADNSIETTIGSAESEAAIRDFTAEARVRAIGRQVAETKGVNNGWMASEDDVMIRDSVRAVANQEVAGLAEHIHREDDLVPDSLISKMADMGYFGMGVPEAYGGLEMGNLSMILTTEELSRVSLAAAGSLITRPEILTKALLQGGTEEQKESWLSRVASGEIMAAISVTEPDFGSDVASVACRAEPAERDGKKGYVVNGAKAWCTFAGRADVIALLLRTNPDPASGAKGLSLFIAEKERFDGHEFEMRQPGGGLLAGKADATPGYRGMHSYTLAFEDFFIPEDNLIGREEGLNRGFYLQMNGFAAGRLQTGGRATGISQAALEVTAAYVNDRKQFKRPIIEFQLTQYKLGRMAVLVQAARQITYQAALAMDADESISLLPAMAKLLACDIAVAVTQEGQLLHGGWGYAEEYPISRYVIDAQVLPIFEGVKPILELKVIARQLLAMK